MKTKILFLLLAVGFAFTSCSEDDSIPNNALAGENGFEFNRTAYNTDAIYITQDNVIILSSRILNNSGVTVQGNFAKFTTSDGSLSKITYNVGSNLVNCTAVVNGEYTDGELQNGQNILGAQNADKGFMRIVDYNSVDQEINIIFEFQRNDGKLVSGSFDGNFERIEL